MALIKLPSTSHVNDIFFDISKKNAKEISGYATIKESIENILLTYPGEILFDSSFGCGIVYQLFSNFSDMSVSSMKTTILRAIAKWEPRVYIDDTGIAINKDVDNHTLYISLTYIVKASGEVDTYKNTFGV